MANGERRNEEGGELKMIPFKPLKDLMVKNGLFQMILKCFSEDLDSSGIFFPFNYIN